MNKILIIGGTGFIGSHLKNALSKQGYEVIIACRMPPAKPEPDINYIAVEETGQNQLEVALAECRHIFHLASSSTPSTSQLNPSHEILTNLQFTAQILELLQRYQNRHLIYISSGGAIYGNVSENFVNEEKVLKPLSYYGAAKASIEAFLCAFQSQTQNHVTILRPSNLYGPGQALKSNFGVIPTLFDRAIRQTTFEIWGDGETVRDYLYIQDFIDLCMRTISFSISNDKFEVFNAGSGQGITINQLSEFVVRITGKAIQKKYIESRSVDVNRIVLDSSNASSRYQWKATTTIEKGLEAAWKYYCGISIR